MFRSCQIIIRELCSLLKLCYSIHNSIGIYKRGVVEQWLATAPHVGVFSNVLKVFYVKLYVYSLVDKLK